MVHTQTSSFARARRHRAPPAAARQQGSVLLVAMIMLLTAAILAAAAFRGSLTSAQVIGNMQWRSEAISAANDAIDRLLSTADFAFSTATVVQQVNATPFLVDVNGDGVNDITVNFPTTALPVGEAAGPRCIRSVPIPAAELDPERPADVGCFNSSGSDSSGLTGLGGAGSVSLCSNTEWTIRVRAVDAVTNTTVDVVQGVGVRVGTDVATNVCQ